MHKENSYWPLYVDDMPIVGKRLTIINDLEVVEQPFYRERRGISLTILGMSILRDKNAKKIWLLEEEYIGKVLQRFSIENTKVVRCSLANHFRLSLKQIRCTGEEKEEMDKLLYASLVGNLMYAVVCAQLELIVSYF